MVRIQNCASMQSGFPNSHRDRFCVPIDWSEASGRWQEALSDGIMNGLRLGLTVYWLRYMDLRDAAEGL